MASRLDRLFVLLESGSSGGTRRAAAAQLGEVAAARPGDVRRLLARLRALLGRREWETRVAAAQALEAVLARVKVWRPPAGVEGEEMEGPADARLRFADFDLAKVVRTGECLMGSEGREYDGEEVGVGLQRQRLRQTLGMDMAQKLGFEQEGFIEDADLERKEEVRVEAAGRRQTAAEVLAGEIRAITGQEVSRRQIDLRHQIPDTDITLFR